MKNQKKQPQKSAAVQEKKKPESPKQKKPVQKKAPAKTAPKNGKGVPSKKWVRPTLWAVIAVLAVVLVFAILLWIGLANTVGQDEPTVPATTPSVPTEPTSTEETFVENMEVVDWTQDKILLDYDLEIIDVGNYTGVYMEDGTNEIVSDVLMIIVENTGEQDVQYAEITMEAGENDAFFSLSTLPAGESVVLLEKSRMAWAEDADYNSATVENVAVFTEPLSLCEDQLKLQILDGAINVTNISGEDITGDVVIYYKNAAADLYYGGITYRVRIEGGIAADEIKQIMASHFSSSGSKIMFVTVG